MVRLLNIILVVWLVSCAETSDVSKREATVKPPVSLPMLHIQPATYHLGDIKEGEAAIATFLVRNNNPQTIELVDIQAACGCTAAEPDSYLIMSGGFTQLKVAVDTSAKQSNIKKTVHITDSLGNQAVASLTFNVVANPHRTGKTTGIFDGQCASCHFDPLVNQKVSSDIYELGCAMCHGADASGGYAMSLKGYSSLNTLKEAISKGNGKAQMPGFAKSEGGPLSPNQIHDLAKWLISLSVKEN